MAAFVVIIITYHMANCLLRMGANISSGQLPDSIVHCAICTELRSRGLYVQAAVSRHETFVGLGVSRRHCRVFKS